MATVANGNRIAVSEGIKHQVLHLSKEAERLLEKNRFVVVHTKAYKDMNEVYQAFHIAKLPIFVTTDSILHTTHLLFDYLLRIIEVGHLMYDLKQLTRSMTKASLDGLSNSFCCPSTLRALPLDQDVKMNLRDRAWS